MNIATPPVHACPKTGLRLRTAAAVLLVLICICMLLPPATAAADADGREAGLRDAAATQSGDDAAAARIAAARNRSVASSPSGVENDNTATNSAFWQGALVFGAGGVAALVLRALDRRYPAATPQGGAPRLLVFAFAASAAAGAAGAAGLVLWLRIPGPGTAATALLLLAIIIAILAWMSVFRALALQSGSGSGLSERLCPVVAGCGLLVLGTIALRFAPAVMSSATGWLTVIALVLPLVAGLAASRSRSAAAPPAGLPPVSREDPYATRVAEYAEHEAYFPRGLQEKYTGIAYIGKGGTARVFRAVRRSDGVTVAVKVPADFDELTGKSFLREMRLWETLRHDHIIRIFAVNILPSPYVEMEFAERSLADVPLPLDPEKAAGIIAGIADAVACAHEKGIVHRDIKPQNILCTKEGKAKLSDWGLGKLLDGPGGETRAGFSLGYAAPEQIAPAVYPVTDERTDIFQLGVVMYELLTGQKPFVGDGPGDLSMAILQHQPPPPSSVRGDLVAFDGIIARCLAKDPAERYPDAGALRAAIAALSFP
ncbi:MAG: serine/threonine protein kinase [Methanomicrobiales archaeon]|nr:serine/threonine protein kinase [Methanomicrobiales archaeon]